MRLVPMAVGTAIIIKLMSSTPHPKIDLQTHLLDAIKQVESGGGKYLVSPAGARGPYQFMPKTAKAYGVDPTDDDWSDDRRGAAALVFDEWTALGTLELALAAYNAGRPNVLKAIKKAGSKEWGIVSKFLPLETRNYVPKVLREYESRKDNVSVKA